MVSLKLLKSYDFTIIEHYFNYILESEINGQRSQVERLIKTLSKEQKKECLDWFNNDMSEDVETVKNY